MAKRKKKIKGEKKLAGCGDCGWEGVRDIIFNGRSDRSECPNCTGHASLTFDGNPVIKPKTKKQVRADAALQAVKDKTEEYKSGAITVTNVECLDCFW